MSEIAERYARIADAFTARLEDCPSESWGNPSPCEEWTAHDVAKHVVATHRTVLARLTGTDSIPPASEEDLLKSWRIESEAVRVALVDPEKASVVVKGMLGDHSFEQLVSRLLCADTLVHTWDLARATGQDERLDPAGMAVAQEFLEPLDEAIRRPGGFGPKLEPPEGADAQTQFLCFVGRRP
ncbi:MAG: TIGR03086 family metal-binding protein [Candidatus Dormibacteraceae bacterium]